MWRLIIKNAAMQAGCQPSNEQNLYTNTFTLSINCIFGFITHVNLSIHAPIGVYTLAYRSDFSALFLHAIEQRTALISELDEFSYWTSEKIMNNY